MATNPTGNKAGSAPAVTQQPRTYQEMLNYMLPTKVVDGNVYVPRITTNNLNDPKQLNDFDHWHGASGSNPHTHVGNDITFGKLDNGTGAVEYIPTSSAVNQNVSVGAPVGGVLSIVPNSSTNEVRITTPAGVVFSLMHMTGLDGSLNNLQVAPGTPIGTMAGYGAGGVVHVHLNVYQTTPIQNANGTTTQQTRYYDPQEVMDLGTAGRYVVKEDKGKKPESAVSTTPASDAFWTSNTNVVGAGQTDVTASRTVIAVEGARTVATTYGNQTIVNTYDAGNTSAGGQAFLTDFSQTKTNTGNWLVNAQARQNQVVQAALSVVLPSESYRENIYSDAVGIPTTGFGYALVIKNGNAYKVRPRAEVEASLRLAGVDDAAIANIDFKALDRVATKLTEGDRAGADTITNSMSDTIVFSSPAQAEMQVANRLAVAYQELTRILGGVNVANDLTANQMGAALSLYDNSPKLVGKNLVAALRSGDTEAALYEIEVKSNPKDSEGVQTRRIDEAALFSNPEPVAGGSFQKPSPTLLPRTPYITNTVTSQNADGTTTTTGTAIGNSSDGLITKGDTVSATTSKDGRTLATSVVHKTSIGTEVTTRIFDPESQLPPDETFTQTDKGGRVVTQISTRDGQVLGDSYTANGVTYTRTPHAGGTDQWHDPNGHTAAERIAQGIVDSDSHFNNHPAPEGNTPSTEPQSDLTQEQSDVILSSLGLKPPVTSSVGIQYADAGHATFNGAVVSDAGGSSFPTNETTSNKPPPHIDTTQAAPETIATTTHNPGTPQDLQAFLSGPGASLSPAQQYALASQLGHLGLGAVDGNTLSLHTLPGGGALLANADGDIVGELSVAPNGSLHLQGNTINADGSTSPVDVHVTSSGQVMTAEQYQEAQFNAAANDAAGTLSLVNSLANLAHFDHLTDLGKLQSLIGLYNQIDGLGGATAALTGSTDAGGNLPGNLGQWGAGLSLVTALQGNDPIAQASAAGAFYNTFANSTGSSLTPIGIPYLQALNLIGAIESGNTVSMIASAVAFIPGWGTAASMAISIIAPLLADKPPPPEGVTHYEWDANGNIQIHVDFNQSHGGEMAQRTAQSVQGLLESIVQNINDRTADTSDNVALNPYLLPRVGFSQAGGAWIEMTTPDGGSYREMIQGENLAQRLFEILTENGGIAPVWQVQTQLGHMQQLQAQGAGQGEIAVQLGAGAGGHAYHGNQAYAIEGNATESADFKTQSFGALVVHLGAGVVASDAVQASTQALQALQAQHAEQKVATSELYRDTEGDGYYEKTQWVSATDAKGNVQGLLVLDYNGNGQIETRDILNLGGNVGQEGNLANDATQATANAALQRNNVEWLDANGDGVLDARDPAFAAIRLWVDLNQDAQLNAGEQADLASLQITSINFKAGEVTYADGHSDALSSTTLQSDTEGVRYTQMQEADTEGKLHTINAGQMLEHEGYRGQVEVVDQGGVKRWGTVREATFEQDALRTGDWEGTAEQDQHRHGGTNMASAPTQTSATGAVSLGGVKRTDGQDKVLTERRVVFVPAIATLGQERADSTIDQMVRSAQEGAMAGGMGAGLGALAMVGLGAVQTTAFAAPDTERIHGGYADGNNLETTARTATQETTYAVRPDASRAYPGDVVPVEPVQGTWQGEPRRLVDAPPPPGVLADVDALQRAGLNLSAYAANHTPVREIRATLVSNATPDMAPAGDAASAVALPATTEMLLDLPKVVGEVLAGTEDTVLRIGTNLLLANDSTANANAPLHISAVGNASHGQVSLQTSLNGAGQKVTEVVFLPDPDFYGTASFTYTVTDTYGLSSTATATLLVENVNDAPYAQGEVVSGASEDATFLIDKTVLLANDGDVDNANNTLAIGWVGNAAHGTVSLDANGNVVFVPDLNFNGSAEFEYRTVDPAGLLSPAVQVVMPVAAVNDAPLAVDDQFQTYVNSTMTIGFAQLIGNDSDVENDTLSLVDVGNASHGAVSIVNGQVEFVPTAGYTGTASFDYLADDGNGGQTWATAFVEVKPPPNLYASINLYGASFYGTGGNSGWRIDMADVSFAVSDDGDTAFSSVALQSLSVLRVDYSNPVSDAEGTYYPYAWQGLAGVNAFSYNNTYMNLDVQRGYGFTDFQSTWRITDDRGLTNIWHLNYSVSGGATSYMEYSGYVGPVVLSLDGSAPSYISTQYSQVRYDLDTDGIADKVAWAAPGSGVLGIDLNGDHQISNASEFAFKQYVDGAQTDLEGLKAFDTNGNGVLDVGDAQWTQFGVWEDKNADGQTQAGEYLTLDALGIATINLQSNAQMHSGAAAGGGASADVTVMGDTTFTRTDGSTGVAADAMLTYQSGVHVQAAEAAEADLARMALLFNQMANTAVTQEMEPLGFVPLLPVEAALAHEELLALQAA